MSTISPGFQALIDAGKVNAERQGARRNALSDEEHEQQLSDHNNTITSLQKKMSTVGPDAPEYAGYQAQLNQTVADRTALFHPDQPGGLARLGKLVWNKATGQHPQAPTETTQANIPAINTPATGSPTDGPGMSIPSTPAPPVRGPAPTPADLKNRAAQELAWGAPGPPANPYKQRVEQRVAAGMSREDAMQAERVTGGIEAKAASEKAPTFRIGSGQKAYVSDGKGYQPMSSSDGQVVIREIPVDAVVPANKALSAAAQRRVDWAKQHHIDPADMTFDNDVQADAEYKQGTTPSRGSTHTSFQNIDGKIVPVTVTNSSSVSFPGARHGGSPSAPAAPPQQPAGPTLQRRQPTSATSGNTISPTFAGRHVTGLVAPGNIDLSNRPNVDNGDGTHSSVFSMGVNVDGKEMLIPGVGDGTTYPARKLSTGEAVDQYKKTGQNLGQFATADDSDAYAQTLHEDQQRGNRPQGKPAPKPAALKRQVDEAKSAAAKAAPKTGPRRQGNLLIGAPIGRGKSAEGTAAFKDRDAADKAFQDVQRASKDPSSLGDKGIVLAWLRGRVNRVTASEIQSVNSLGGASMALENGVARVTKGQMSDRQRQWFLKSAKDNFEIASGVAAKYDGSTPPASTGSGMSDEDFLRNLK